MLNIWGITATQPWALGTMLPLGTMPVQRLGMLGFNADTVLCVMLLLSTTRIDDSMQLWTIHCFGRFKLSMQPLGEMLPLRVRAWYYSVLC
jgi:hypothetical protein